MRAGLRSRTAAWLLLSGLLSACSALSNGSAVREARQDAEQGRPAQAAAKLEVLRTASPDDFEVRLELGVAYYKLARRALDADDQSAYTRYLGQALEEVVEAARIDPESPSPHVWMGIIAAYRAWDTVKSARASTRLWLRCVTSSTPRAREIRSPFCSWGAARISCCVTPAMTSAKLMACSTTPRRCRKL